MIHPFKRKKAQACKITADYIFILILCFFLFSCGYHFRPAGGSIGVSLDSIAIPVFSSPSSFMGLEGEFTRIVREEFITHSRVRIVKRDEAQGVLCCRIHSVKTIPLTYSVLKQTIHGYTSTDKVTKSRTLRVRLNVKLTDTKTGKIIWQDSTLTEEANFQVSTDPLSTLHNQRQAFISIAHSISFMGLKNSGLR
jgi:hypothetical protein